VKKLDFLRPLKPPVLVLALFFCLATCIERNDNPAQPGPDTEIPQYGDVLNVGTVLISLSALSWDPIDWSWKGNHDAGAVREMLMAADFSHARRNGGDQAFTSDVYIPDDALRGELAERWEWEDPLTLVFHLRRNIYFPEKPGLMKEREFVAADVVSSFNYTQNSPKKQSTYLGFVKSIEARDDHTVVFRLSQYNNEWPYRIGYGYYSAIFPQEAVNVDQRDWRNLTGTGPFSLARYVPGNMQKYKRNLDYWDTVQLAGKDYQLPFADELTYRIIRDESTALSSLRTGKLDILEAIRWINVSHLKETSPELKWNRWLASQGTFIALRVDKPPLNDLRVRRALNIAINKPEIVKLFYGGQAEIMAFPQHPNFGSFYQGIKDQPASVQELFKYDPAKARKLLADAGLSGGFDLKIQVCSCSGDHMELLPLIASYWDDIGVRVAIEPMEYASFLSAMTSRQHGPAYMMDTGHSTPISSLRKNFQTGQVWNPSQYSNTIFDKKIESAYKMQDPSKQIEAVRILTSDILDEAPYVWLPTPYNYTAWWPWVKNYGGELSAGAVRPGPIYSRIWIDQKLKQKMGF
jgi:peptide/nickel transport system substrate-binding protein